MAFAPIFAGNVVLAAILHARSPVLALAAIASFAFSMHLWAGPLTGYIASARAGLPLERLRRDLTRRRGPGPPRRLITDVVPPVWVAVPAPNHTPRQRVPATVHGEHSATGTADHSTQPGTRAEGDKGPESDVRTGPAAHGEMRPGFAAERDAGPGQGLAEARDAGPGLGAPGDARPDRTGAGRAARADLDYRLCIARHQVRGEPVILAFSDGTAQAWHPATRVATRPHPAGPVGRSPEAAAALESLVRDLSRNGSTSLESVLKNHSEEHPEPTVQHAVQAAVLWGLIATRDGRDAQRLYALLGEPDPAEAAGIALTITDAGRVWLDSDSGEPAASGRHPRKDPAAPGHRPSKPKRPQRTPRDPSWAEDNPSHVEGAPSYVPGAPSHVPGAPSHVPGAPSHVPGAPSHVEGAPSHVEGAPSRVEGDVIRALAELLRIPEVWERPGLRPARDTITTAVAGGHPDTAALRSAVDQVLTLAGGLVLGLTGAGAYQVLQSFAR